MLKWQEYCEITCLEINEPSHACPRTNEGHKCDSLTLLWEGDSPELHASQPTTPQLESGGTDFSFYLLFKGQMYQWVPLILALGR